MPVAIQRLAELKGTANMTISKHINSLCKLVRDRHMSDVEERFAAELRAMAEEPRGYNADGMHWSDIEGYDDSPSDADW